MPLIGGTPLRASRFYIVRSVRDNDPLLIPRDVDLSLHSDAHGNNNVSIYNRNIFDKGNNNYIILVIRFGDQSAQFVSPSLIFPFTISLAFKFELLKKFKFIKSVAKRRTVGVLR